MTPNLSNRLKRRLPPGLAGICTRACCVALIVGTVLNGINQGDALIRGEEINLMKVILTYFVPFAVSTHGALSAVGKASRAGGG